MLSQKKADLTATLLQQALARLAPWSGDAAMLFALPRLAQHEIDEVRTTLSNLAADATREALSAARAREEAAALTLQIEQLSS